MLTHRSALPVPHSCPLLASHNCATIGISLPPLANSPLLPLPPHNIPYLVPHSSQKCDEQREEGDSCRTCRRLQLNCLGWGPRRPDWMRVRVYSRIARARRTVGQHDKLQIADSPIGTKCLQDKEAVQAYKMEIKTHLLRLGLIRGQPRTSLSAGTSNQASSIVGTPGVNGTSTSRTGSDRGSFSFPFDDTQQFEFSFPSGLPAIPGKER